MYFVYAIGDAADLESKTYDSCYIGVTNNPFNRWKAHVKSGYTVSKAIAKYNWTYASNMKILFEGSSEECFSLEEKYRPIPLMGLNEASGGKGGYTSYSAERNEKISNSLKGKTKEYGHKISATKKLNGSSKGSKNAKAKKWRLVDPNGVEYFLNGELFSFCEEHKLSVMTLRNNLGNRIGEISPKFRDHGKPMSREKRISTTGWTLFKEN